MRTVPDGALTARHIPSDPRIRRAPRILWDRIAPIAFREGTVPAGVSAADPEAP